MSLFSMRKEQKANAQYVEKESEEDRTEASGRSRVNALLPGKRERKKKETKPSGVIKKRH